MTEHLPEFLLARVAEKARAATPRTVVVSGGTPAPEVPNCIGPDGNGGCLWRLEHPPGEPTGWWRAAGPDATIREHEATHATPEQRLALAECDAIRRIVEFYRRLKIEHAPRRPRDRRPAGRAGTRLGVRRPPRLPTGVEAVSHPTHTPAPYPRGKKR